LFMCRKMEMRIADVLVSLFFRLKSCGVLDLKVGMNILPPMV
jgi:hypothetical protein